MCCLSACVVEANKNVSTTMVGHRGNVPCQICSTDLVCKIEPVLQLNFQRLRSVIDKIL